MNKFAKLASALALCVALPLPALARNMVLAIPGDLPVARKEALTKSAVRHVLDVVGPGERAHLVDATTGHLIGAFVVPEGSRYDNPRAKVAANAAFMRGVKDFMARGGVGAGQVNIPDVLNVIARTIPPEKPASLILMADPRSLDTLAPSLDMSTGAVPGDGHILADLGRSPYGTLGTPGSLEGYDVYLADIASDWAVSNPHEQAVGRFWANWVAARGGNFQMMSDDLGTVMSLSGQDRAAAMNAAQLVPTDKLEMIQFQPDTGQMRDLYAAPILEEPAPEPLWREARDVSVGISWDCASCDFDLYLRPNATAEVIYFGQAKSALGQLFKDHLSSPSLTNGYETVALNGAVDLSQMQLSVNHYGGRASGPVTLELRIAIGTQVWAQEVQMNAGRGNKGDGAHQALVERVVPNNAWVLIDPLDVLGER